ncbi:MAG: LamG domain-containing protein [Gammaproteobacteria bacterium]|nr:MAG: LamG domain-containing protein [Gammaproteobacteria bacterium]
MVKRCNEIRAMKFSQRHARFIFQTLFVFGYVFLFSTKAWAIACDAIFTNGIQATGASGNINLSYHSAITGGSATLKTKTLTDNSSWVACSGSSCVGTGVAATTSTVTFSTGTGTNGVISVADNGTLSKASGDYSTVTVGQQATLTFSTANGTYKTTAFTTNFQSIVQLQSGDYWINGNLTIGQQTVLKRVATSGTTRIFVNGNVNLGYKVTTQSFTSAQLLIYATGTITSANEADLSAYIYAGGAVSFGFQSTIDGGISGSSFTATGNDVTVKYEPTAFSTANFAPFCSGSTVIPVLLGSWNMDELSWNGTAGEVKDTSGNNNHGRARVATAGGALPSTTSGTAAYTAANQSTCRYGTFDGTGSPTRIYDYVELSGFPTLPNGFTFAAWIRSTNAGAQHQRILVRDDADNGWGLSLADGTGNPALRFFNRNVTNNGAVTGQGTNPNCGVFCVDTNAVIASNTWYYVAAAVDTSAKTVTLYVYNASGALQAKAVGAYSGTWVDGTGTVGIGGETSASSEGRQSSWHFLGNIDEVNIYSGALAQTAIESLLTTVRTCPAPDHYELDVPANGIACLGTDVTVRACADSVSPCTNIDYSINTNVTLATTAGALTATTPALVSGTKTVDLFYAAAVDGVTATVTLSGEATAATNARKCCVGGTCTVANSCSTTFNTSGFIFSKTITGGVDNPATQVAGKLSNTSPDNNMTYLRAVRTNTSTGTCVARLTSPTTVKMGYKCVNPNTCISGETLKINTTTIQANSNAASPVIYSDVNLTFDANGSAQVPINYSDVGQVQLFASLALGQTSTDPAYTLVGQSNTFIVRPNQVSIPVVGVTRVGGGGTYPGATNQAGGNFVSAGTPFRVSIQSTNFLGGVTPNFGRETSSQSQNLTLLTNSLVYPAGGTATPLTYIADTFSFVSAGTYANSTVVWPQVGSITIMPGLSDYLSTGPVGGVVSGTIGRFYPDRYRVVPAAASAGYVCGSFSYMGQANLQIIPNVVAESAGSNPVIVTNYDNLNFGYGSGSNLVLPTYAAENNSDTINRSSRLSVPFGKWHMGVYDDPAISTFARQLTGPDGPYGSLRIGITSLSDPNLTPFDLAVPTTNTPASAAKDMLGATAIAFKDPAAPSNYLLDVRYGRLRLDDAFGPETFQLPVNFFTEHWVGNRFIQNANDGCTRVLRSDITFPAGAISIDGNRTVALTGGSTQATFADLSATSVGFSAGTAGMVFTSPAGGRGRFVVGVSLVNMPWLRFDWNQDGNYLDALLPNATYEFGSYRGNDRIIYWRERLQ